MSSKKSVCAIILAAGSGSRMGVEVTKQRIVLAGHSILWHTVNSFDKCNLIESIIIVCRDDEVDFVTNEVKGVSKIKKVVIGGKCRAESAVKGFLATDENDRFIAIHDGARCLITPEDIERVVETAIEHGASSACTKVVDTVKRVDNQGCIVETIPRGELVHAATPQVFLRDLYKLALNNCDSLEQITDDNMLLENIGINIYTVDTVNNIKITSQRDLIVAEEILSRRLCDA